MERSSPLGSRFGEDERAVRKVESCEVISATKFGANPAPVESAGDHEVQDEPESVVELEDDALADAVKSANSVAFGLFDAWLEGAEEKWTCNADVGERLANDAWLKRREIGRDVG